VNARNPLKWTGGKGKLVPSIRPHLPATFGRYFEPFCGGAALFWALRPERAVLSDANPHLITTYRVIRDDVEALIADLSTRRYDRAEFMATRERLNAGRETDVWRAATFIYINKTGFNGLWRVNGKGGCNVPFGDYDNPTICDADNLRACSAALHSVEIHCRGYEAVEAEAQPGDLVYLDPPYVPESKTANFTSYTAEKFGRDDQERLAAVFRRLVRRGVHCVLSNSDTETARRLYAGFYTVNLSRSGSINCKGEKRQRVGEILVLGGTWYADPASLRAEAV
jgi:DNA adenine methylase